MKSNLTTTVIAAILACSAVWSLGCNSESAAPSEHDGDRAVSTLRVDYNHAGTFGSESF